MRTTGQAYCLTCSPDPSNTFMSHANYDSRYHQRPWHDSYYSSSRDVNAYSRHEQPAAPARKKLMAMRSSANSNPYASYSSYGPRAPPLPHRSAVPPQYRSYTCKQTWPPSPSVEDETASHVDEGEPPEDTRGAVDQEKLLEEIEHSDDRRYVLMSDPSDGNGTANASSPITGCRRTNFAKRGNMAHIDTHIEDPPVYTERVSTPYAYMKPQKQSTASSSRADFLSPEPITPASAGISRSVPSRDAWDKQRDQNAKPQSPRNDVFDDLDFGSEDNTHLCTAERKPARYSFVKSDLQKEDVRTNLYDSQPKPEPRRRESGQRPPPSYRKGDSSGSSKDNSYAESPRSSSSSLNSGNKMSRPALVETGYYNTSHTPSRSSSPMQHAPSPKLPSRLHESPPSSRPSSRGNTRPASPLSFSTTIRPSSPGRVPITDADWHSTYPPIITRDRSRPPSRFGRHETMPVSNPRIDVPNPLPASATASALPYPVDDRPLNVFMPSEAHYQFDHSTVASPQQGFPDSPRVMASSIPGSSRVRDEPSRPAKNKIAISDEQMRTRRTRSNSVRSQNNVDGRREQSSRLSAKLDLDRPLPSCPREMSTQKYDDWYSLQGYHSFDICPSCFVGVFRDTQFAVHFSQTRLGERPTERFCDFSSPWIRLAWLLTIKQRRPSLELLYALADIADVDRPCPDDRELSSDRVTWYGIPDQRDGVHVANFSICSCDKRMIETLFPTMRGYFTKLPSTYDSSALERYMCSLRTSSRRFPKYLDLLVELDAEAQDLNTRPNINRFIQMARDNAFKGECGKDKSYVRKAWHFTPSLPELTICEECYDELVWPAIQSKSTPSSIPRLFNKAIQLVPNEEPDVGSSCCLYSPRMRKVFNTSVKEEDFTYLKHKAVDRKRAEARLAREKKGIMNWMAGLERGGTQWNSAKSELKALDKEWTNYWE